MKQILTKKTLIVGCGLMGTSLALALKKSNPKNSLTGLDTNIGNLKLAKTRGAFDEILKTVPKKFLDFDLVILATPVDVTKTFLKNHLNKLQNNKIILDVGSVQGILVEAGKSIPHFVSCHPMAGGHTSGPQDASADLFVQKICFVDSSVSPKIQKQAMAIWRSVGALPVKMDSQSHDQLLSLTSHMVHLVATSLAATVGAQIKNQKVRDWICGGGVRDTTRIAMSSFAMWKPIFEQNRVLVLKSLQSFEEKIKAIRIALEKQNWKALQKIWEEGARFRKSLR